MGVPLLRDSVAYDGRLSWASRAPRRRCVARPRRDGRPRRAPHWKAIMSKRFIVSLLLPLVILLDAVSAVAAKRAFTIEDLYRVRSVSDLAVSSDGRSIAFVVADTDLPHGKRVSHVW